VAGLQQVISDLTADVAEVDKIVAGLDETQWDSPTPAPGWTVKHQIAHLSFVFRIAGLAAAEPETFAAVTAGSEGSGGSFNDAVNAALEEYLGDPVEVLHSRWRAESADSIKALAAVPEGQLVPWLVNQVPAAVLVESLVDDVAAMAGHVAGELLRLPVRDQVLFGHSLGAVVAYETALVLRDMGEEPGRLCASACMPPGHMENRQVHRVPDDEFWATLCELGGIEPGIAENAELRELLLPTIRSDLRAHATYQPRPGTKPLSWPVSCYHGAGDPLVDETRLREWAGVTSGEFTLKVRPGGHFHVGTDVAELVSDILGREPV
jgi:pyochelin biosynthetic protein PchC